MPPYYSDHPLVRKDWALYLESIQILDRKVGQILKRLDDDGLSDDTIVFFMSDHGRAHIRCKQFLYDGGIHIPLIVRWPGRFGAGTVSDELVSGVDFARDDAFAHWSRDSGFYARTALPRFRCDIAQRYFRSEGPV